jgi:hypothetical protein
MRTSVRSPWQNGIAERWVGSARRELLDYITPLMSFIYADLCEFSASLHDGG